MSFQLCGKRVDFCFPLRTTSVALAIHPSLATSMHSTTLVAIPRVKVFDGNGGPIMSSVTFSYLPPPIPAILDGTFDHTRERMDTTTTLHIFISSPP